MIIENHTELPEEKKKRRLITFNVGSLCGNITQMERDLTNLTPPGLDPVKYLKINNSYK